MNNAKLLSKDSIEIKIPPMPIGKLFYLDFFYDTLLEERHKKLGKILERMCD